jgi:hypothetical protein
LEASAAIQKVIVSCHNNKKILKKFSLLNLNIWAKGKFETAVQYESEAQACNLLLFSMQA